MLARREGCRGRAEFFICMMPFFFLFLLGNGAYICFLHNLIMAKTNHVHMRYVTKPNTDDVFDLFKRMMEARDSVNSNYKEYIVCTVSTPGFDTIHAFIKEKQPGKLEETVKEFISIVNPFDNGRNELEYSQFRSGYSAIEKALPSGKVLKRKWYIPFGKYVVDAK
jgi:hypothetical protein